MSEEITVITDDTPKADVETTEVEDQRVPYERFQQANKKAKDAANKASQLEKTVADLQAAMEDREHAGLPELEQLKKRLEAAEKRAEDADRRASDADTALQTTRKERWVTAAASEHNFADPSDASAFLDLTEIEDEKDAERAVKRLAGKKKHLLRSEERQLPGRVLQDGRQVDRKAEGGINVSEEAQMLADGLRQFASRD